MTIIIGIILGILYIIQPLDAVRAPVDWLNSTMITHVSTVASAIIPSSEENEIGRLLLLILTVGAPGVAGLLVNLIAPLGRLARGIFGIGTTLVSLGAFGTLPWHQALLFSMATGVVGLVMTLLSGALMESVGAFFSITLGASQIRSVLVDEPSAAMNELVHLVSNMLHISLADSSVVCLCLAFLPLSFVAFWFLYRLSSFTRHIPGM